jgi:UDP-3-O-[3-hydroxymyristoyl] glucosamine N-acyltransferase
MPLTLNRSLQWLDASVQRDGAFASLGFVSHAYPEMLIFLEHERFLDAAVANRNVRCVLTTRELATRVPAEWGVAMSAAPRRAFYDLHARLVRETDFYGATSNTVVAASARIHPAAVVAGGGVQIGERVVVEPCVVIHPRVTIGDDVVVRSGTVLGSEGFQVQHFDGRAMRVPHGGHVRIARGVDIHTNCSIDRALFGGETVLGEDTTLDSLVYVAHDVWIGRLCRVGAGASINGSTVIGDEAWIGPNATVSSGLRIGARASVTLGSVVTRDVHDGQHVTGNFAIDHERFLDHLRRTR